MNLSVGVTDTKQMSKKISQMRNPETSAVHTGIRKWLVTNSKPSKWGKNGNVNLWK